MSSRETVVEMRKRRRRKTLLWCLIATAIVITLLATEQIALLYVLTTIGMAVLLLIVAFADLGGAKNPTESAPYDDAAAIADGKTTAAATLGATGTRNAARRR